MGARVFLFPLFYFAFRLTCTIFSSVMDYIFTTLFLKKCGLSFAEMHRRGVDAVVARMNLQYKTPLRCDDEFISCINLKKEGLRYVFYQDIYRAADNKLCFKGVIDLVCLIDGRLAHSKEYDEAFGQWI